MGKIRNGKAGYAALFRSVSTPFEPVKDELIKIQPVKDDPFNFQPSSESKDSTERASFEKQKRGSGVDLSELAELGRRRLEERASQVHEDSKVPKLQIVPIRAGPSSAPRNQQTPSSSGESSISRVDTLPLYTAPSLPLQSDSQIEKASPDELPCLQKAEEENKTSSPLDTGKNSITIYHIYHSGYRTDNYEIHTISDKEAPLPQVHDPTAPNYVDDEKYRTWKPSLWTRTLSFRLNVQAPDQRFIKRSIMTRNLKLDSRTATAPYYIHNPRIGQRWLPHTLRAGGSKAAPTVCLIRDSVFWWRYTFIFDDRLAKDGVIDGRGVVSARYGSKMGKNGTLKGHKFIRRRVGDTGREWHRQEKARRLECKGKDKDKDKGKGKGTGTGKSEEDLDFAEPITPEEVVHMKWKSVLSLKPRQYHFHWSGIDFYWKGTATVSDRKLVGFLMGFCHLKLVAAIPSTDPRLSAKDKKNKSEEVCLANYICLLAQRKAGRLEVFENVVEDLVKDHILPAAYDDAGLSRVDAKHGTERDAIAQKKQSRMQHLIMASLNCMIRSETEKRELIVEILVEVAQNVS
jgi:hypothetical protein